MSYFDRVRVTHHEPTLAEEIRKMAETYFGESDPEPIIDRLYLDDDEVSDGLGTLNCRTAVQKKEEDEFADRHLRLLI